MYAWQTAKVTLKDCIVGTIRSRSCSYQTNNSGKLVIDSGTTVDELDVLTNTYFESYVEKLGLPIVIKAGATVKTLKLNGRQLNKYVLIEEGAVVNKFIE